MLNTFGMAVNTLPSLFNFDSSKLSQVALFHLLAHLICKQLHATEFTLIQTCKFFTECIYYILLAKTKVYQKPIQVPYVTIAENFVICKTYSKHITNVR